MISVVLNGYKRAEYLDLQIKSIKEQSVKVKEILIWQNYYKNFNNKIDKKIVHANCNQNLGVWSRFAFALNSNSNFVCVFDDDTIPGKNWLKNCMECMNAKPALLGARGVRFASNKKYIVGQEFGWNNPNDKIEKVDIVGHSWFLKREWLSTFWRELPSLKQSKYVGEDIHFSYVLKKYLNIDTYVPPHPKEDRSKWGSDPYYAMKIGTDKFAISYNTKRQKEMDDILIKYISKGFKLQFLDELRLKGFYLKNKIKLSKIIKKITNK